MDSIFAKPLETELVLVTDDNDFVDPLAEDFDYEEPDEDTKLQLDDTICAESEFQLNECDDDHDEDKKPIRCQTSSFKEDSFASEQPLSNNVKVEIKEESNDSLDYGDQNIQSHSENDSDFDSDDVPLKKPEVISTKDVVRLIPESSAKIEKIDDEAKEDFRAEECKDVKKEKHNSSKSEKEPKPKKKRIRKPPVLKEGEKPPRPYSKRHAIERKEFNDGPDERELLRCKICDIHFEKSPFFTEHMRLKHSIDKPFECHVCSKPYRIISLLAEHVRVHFNHRPYQCTMCERAFTQLQPFKAHVRKMHTGERPYHCDFVNESNEKCAMSFFDTKTYREHIRMHKNEQPYACEICQKKFNHSGSYQAHMRSHLDERPYQCTICGKSFVQISTHKAHMLTHSDEFNFPCTWNGCTKKFKQATNLKLHMRVHTGECPYKCKVCGRAFAQLVTYRNHEKIHTNSKPFLCPIEGCGKAFRHRNTHKRHIQIHTGEKPFQCDICFKKLASKPSLQSHRRKHEREKQQILNDEKS